MARAASSAMIGEAAAQTEPPRGAAAGRPLHAPALAPNVRPPGEMQGSGFADRQWLVERDGRFIQLTELLYRIAERANGERTTGEIAAGVTDVTEWRVTPDNVRHLIQTKLAPLGIVATAGGSPLVSGGVGARSESRSPLQVNLRRRLIGPALIEPITRVLQALYAPPVLIPALILIAASQGWLYLVHGADQGLRAAFSAPALLLVVFAIVLVSGVFHELGHAAALRYGGGRVRGIGVGFYLV